MSTDPKTQVRGPFPGFPGAQTRKPKKKQGPTAPINLATLAIVDDELPEGRTQSAGHKYDELFGSMKPGQAIKCQSVDVGRISKALRSFIERHQMSNYMVRSVSEYEGSKTGRVWLLKADKPEDHQKGGAQ